MNDLLTPKFPFCSFVFTFFFSQSPAQVYYAIFERQRVVISSNESGTTGSECHASHLLLMIQNEEMTETDGWICLNMKRKAGLCSSDDRFWVGFAGGGLVLVLFRSFVSWSVTNRIAKAEPVSYFGGREHEKATKFVLFVLRGPPD